DLLAGLPHVVVDTDRRVFPYSVLEERGVTYRVGLRVSDFLLVPVLVARAGGVALFRYQVAAAMRELAELRIEEFPFPLTGLGIDMVWNPRSGDQEFVAWFRALLLDAAARLCPPPGGPGRPSGAAGSGEQAGPALAEFVQHLVAAELPVGAVPVLGDEVELRHREHPPEAPLVGLEAARPVEPVLDVADGLLQPALHQVRQLRVDHGGVASGADDGPDVRPPLGGLPQPRADRLRRALGDGGHQVVRRGAVLRGTDPPQRLVEPLVDERPHQLAAGGEVRVEGHARGARRGRDVVHRGAGVPLRVEEFERRFQQQTARHLLVRLTKVRHARILTCWSARRPATPPPLFTDRKRD